MRKTINKTKLYIIKHKVVCVFVLLVLATIGYWGYKKFTSTAGEIRYVTAKVEKGAIVVSVSGSGQVSSLSQVDIKAKASGDAIYLAAKDGERIGMGGLVAKLDTKDAEKSVRDAEVNLESAKITLEKLKIEKSSENMNADLAKSYDDGFNTVSNVFLDLPDIITGMNDMFFKSTINTSQSNTDWYEGQVSSTDREKVALFKKNFSTSYAIARNSYDKILENYKIISRTASGEIIETLILNTYNTVKLVSDSIKNAKNYVDFVVDSLSNLNHDIPVIINTHKTNLNAYTSKANSNLLSLLDIKTSIKSYKDAFYNADLDIRSSELSLKQKENSLQDAKDKLADYFIRAPFAGTVAKINIKKSDSIASGTVVATLITESQLAEISMNEVDVAKIKIGQKTKLTFDAIPDLGITGVVADIDAIGAVSQGVVTYIVKISFDTQDDRVKSGMSVTAAIVTDTKDNVLIVPNSAIKSQAGKSYVEQKTPVSVRIPVETGISNDTATEIISGLKEGDEIITRSISAASNTPTAPSIFGASAPASRGASGNVRLQTR
ncbi:hypothetical protein A2W67_01185 [Candidatus Nomurabacteria bacterium RIFCSPLOWO2_02_40_28]|uniref:Efflux transporter, RND family, MFP subunit n=2 Tax=Candidatus Nomuraibacteriota TaxID=1752729 RepID=A0A837HU32_9BACT|nr:MAG: hypothetical protein UT27_C0001G0064 [Candidatus Nomurabacteria bacterium GW2011_GWD2_39_12]KKR20669.1 MAG: hypothetical protein UT51_C0002G0104 [Candidatus Nomurabacteria bacterium GW2011_GWC2_39_41]KKR37402.1 MAG: hypothetical protein UT70_C0001G0078 [Candidatus Nomurabacteria bacterium GW2011_GWE2_40_10]KKR38650.1 MAG: hypothetical protein UT73_C0002G0135 [Candidatus Nomurabacteria bacterium GW2011_GWB1_40_11]KKR40375.1 MAG: hypothetical protein UT74_C0001G0109 [Parcubacteria group b